MSVCVCVCVCALICAFTCMTNFVTHLVACNSEFVDSVQIRFFFFLFPNLVAIKMNMLNWLGHDDNRT